ncbi:MAG TPA: hypothetical protein PLP42_04025 [Acidobacteriota bacterium]|nr:hypothetical protein [Acidobacteriota bacterium]
MNLPKQVGQWRLTEGPQRIDATTIFDYMNGGGELYLGFRFRYLDVYDFQGTDDTRILVEVYQMETSDDAFGLLSLDRDGEKVSFGPAGEGIYGAGLLRLWSGDTYARILAEQETPESREVVMTLAESVCRGRRHPAPPAFLGCLPPELDGYRLDPDRVSYFRSYLVLNSIFFLSNENILMLGLNTEAITASYSRGHSVERKRPRLIEVRYESESSALAAYQSFLRTYLPESNRDEVSGETSIGLQNMKIGAGETEDGWVGHTLAGRTLVLAFECPSESLARGWVNTAVRHLMSWEESHD